MSENSVNFSQQYDVLLKQMMVIRRQAVDLQVQRDLAALAKVKNKSRYVRELEAKLSQELATHHRLCRLETILEMIEDSDEVRPHIVW